MHISKSEESIDFLSSQFPQASFLLYRSFPEEYISCFVCWVDTAERLGSIWRSVTGVIAMEYQSGLQSKFEAWNIYLVFVVASAVSEELKYEIENDKFSMRKMIVSAPEIGINIVEYLNNEILGADLNLKQVFSYVPTPDTSNSGGLYEKVMALARKKASSGNSFTIDDVMELADWVSENEI